MINEEKKGISSNKNKYNIFILYFFVNILFDFY